MSKKQYPSIDLVCQSLRYSKGRLFWKKRPRDHFPSESEWKRWNARYAGKEAGSIAFGGGHGPKYYRVIVYVNDISIPRSIIVWAIFNGRWPEFVIDHKDTNTLNDNIRNLREATNSQSGANKRIFKNNSTGFKGVTFNKQMGKFTARITFNYSRKFLGYFDTVEEAGEAYARASKRYFGRFARSK